MDYTKRIKGTRIKPIDILSEDFTFGQRLYIGKLIQAGSSDFELLQGVIYALHERPVKLRHIAALVPYLIDVLEKLQTWVEREKMLHYEPTMEERQAGCDEVQKKLHEFTVIDSIAVRMGISHNAALQLPYDTVYKILLKDHEASKFERRLHKIYERKWKQ